MLKFCFLGWKNHQPYFSYYHYTPKLGNKDDMSFISAAKKKNLIARALTKRARQAA